jgi:hypothetical protein
MIRRASGEHPGDGSEFSLDGGYVYVYSFMYIQLLSSLPMSCQALQDGRLHVDRGQVNIRSRTAPECLDCTD